MAQGPRPETSEYAPYRISARASAKSAAAISVTRSAKLVSGVQPRFFVGGGAPYPMPRRALGGEGTPRLQPVADFADQLCRSGAEAGAWGRLRAACGQARDGTGVAVGLGGCLILKPVAKSLKILCEYLSD